MTDNRQAQSAVVHHRSSIIGHLCSMSYLYEIINLTLSRTRLAFNPEAHVILCLPLRQTTLAAVHWNIEQLVIKMTVTGHSHFLGQTLLARRHQRDPVVILCHCNRRSVRHPVSSSDDCGVYPYP